MNEALINALRYNLEALQDSTTTLDIENTEVENLYRELASFVKHFDCAAQLDIDLVDLAAEVGGAMLPSTATNLFDQMDEDDQESFLQDVSERYTLTEWLGDWDLDDVSQWASNNVPEYQLLSDLGTTVIKRHIKSLMDFKDLLECYSEDDVTNAGYQKIQEAALPKPRIRLHTDGSIEVLHLVIPAKYVEKMPS